MPPSPFKGPGGDSAQSRALRPLWPAQWSRHPVSEAALRSAAGSRGAECLRVSVSGTWGLSERVQLRGVHQVGWRCSASTGQISDLNMQPETSPEEIQWTHEEIQAFIGSRVGYILQSKKISPRAVGSLGHFRYVYALQEPLRVVGHAEAMGFSNSSSISF